MFIQSAGPETALEARPLCQFKKVLFLLEQSSLLRISGISVGHQHEGRKNSCSQDLAGAKVYRGYSDVFQIC